MKTAPLILDRQGDIAIVRLNRPDKHNGMDFAMLDAVVDTAEQLRSDRSLRGVVLTGSGPSFCAGLDFKTVLGKPAQAAVGYLELFKPYANKFQRWSLAWRDIGVPVIAAIHGNCFGAGIQLALGADIRIATADAKVSIMEAKWGLIPDMGGAVLLREVVAMDVAKELTFTGRVISGAEAKALGLVSHLAEDPLAAALALLDEMAARSPDATAAGKFLLQEAWHGSAADAAAAERRWQRALMGFANQRISVARNTQKSAAPFKPRRIR